MRSKVKNPTKTYIISIAVALGAGLVSSLVSMGKQGEYAALKQPPLSPPGWLFPVVWTILFILMGISAARVYLNTPEDFPFALKLYCLQLVLNVLWTPLYFALNLRLAAFVLLLILLGTVIYMTVEFKKIDRTAAYLQIPYIVWLLFAGYLNLATYILNG
ncbi:MAG: tryptophan-rich sensory protein [Clostridia bacterium]|nr:tryptophan-rich sensory protein [Clostridia bacterium]